MKLALIPARGGSKRIPRKNIKPFAGKPIIAYAIAAAQQAGCFNRVIVSTDDDEIAEVAKQYGAEVPFRRPPELSNDTATTAAVIRHVIEWYAKEGAGLSHVCCIYAAAPFVQAADILAAYDLLTASAADYCFPVTPFASPIQRALKRRADGRLEMFQPEHLNTRSQDLPEAFHDAGQFYWGRAEAFQRGAPLFGPTAVPLILPRWRVQDIDTPDDWARAELMYEALIKRGEVTP